MTSMINFEETELRLGLPGELTPKGSSGGGKRGFSETASVDLKLNLSSNNDLASASASVSPSSVPTENTKDKITTPSPTANDPAKPPAKAQVVGWPPVRSFRKNIVSSVQRNNNEEVEKSGAKTSNKNINNHGANNSRGGALVKVSMDGAPYLRKVDLKLYNTYQELSDALAKMFSSFTIGKCGSQGTNTSDYVPTYQDKDGDWMLVGDVPWEMFVESCKRLRIMKGSEAIGLAPRAVEKVQNQKLK